MRTLSEHQRDVLGEISAHEALTAQHEQRMLALGEEYLQLIGLSRGDIVKATGGPGWRQPRIFIVSKVRFTNWNNELQIALGGARVLKSGEVCRQRVERSAKYAFFERIGHATKHNDVLDIWVVQQFDKQKAAAR